MPRWVLDANQYLFTFGGARQSECVTLLDGILRQDEVEVVICRTIVQEVVGNMDQRSARAFFTWLSGIADIDEDEVVPFDLWVHYEISGFKPADAFIAAYTEHVGAAFLVSENRHFLRARTDLPFRVMDARSALEALARRG